MAGEIKSPCVSICTLDVRKGICLGCARTTAEISAWRSLSDRERDVVVADLPRRHALLSNDVDSFPPPPLGKKPSS